MGEKIEIYYDGICPTCLKTMSKINKLDFFNSLKMIDFRDRNYAINISYFNLEKLIHVKDKNGTIYKGFDALIAISKKLPVLWIFTPFMYLLKITKLGDFVYSIIANNRKLLEWNSCDDNCNIGKKDNKIE